MAVSPDQALHQQPASTQPEPAVGQGGDGQAGPSSMTASQPGSAHASPGAASVGQKLSSDAIFRQALEQQITQAVQPVLDEFRQQMAQEFSHQASDAEMRGVGGQAAAHVSQTAQEGVLPPASQPSTSQPVPTQEPSPQAAQTGAQSTQGETPTEVPVKNIVQQTPPTGALAPVMQAVEQHGAQWVTSVLVAGLGALLAESTHVAVQQHAEQGLHALLQQLFDAVPPGMTNQEMQEKTERTLQLLLRESLDAVFAEGMRTTVQQHGQESVQQSVHGDFGGAVQHVQDTLKALVATLIAVMRRHQRTILRLLVALALLALANSLEHSATPSS